MQMLSLLASRQVWHRPISWQTLKHRGVFPEWDCNTCEVKATEKRRMPADTTDKLSCAQKLIQPTRWQALAVRSSDFLAGSDIVMT